MNIACFERRESPKEGQTHLGIVHGDRVLDLGLCDPDATAGPVPTDILSFIRSGAAGLARARHLVRSAPDSAWRGLSEVRLRAPIVPSTILCSGSNYHAHNREKAASPDSGREPEFFVKTAECVIGPGDAIVRDPRVVRKLDCETELAVVIGRAGRHITVDRALDHVFGYTIVNDVTARDKQVRRTSGGDVWYDLGRGKVFDTSAPLGPFIVTADAIDDPQRLSVETRINGELRQRASTADMIWSCAELISNFSSQIALRPGMVIITGTPAGTAWSTDPELGGRYEPQPGLVAATRYCEAGDVVECRIGGIGTLKNAVASLTAAE